MDRSLLTLVLSCAVVLFGIAQSGEVQCFAAEPATNAPSLTLPADGVIVLQDGGVLAGRVSRSGDRYIVARDTGELNVSASKVTMVCQSLAEAYERKRGQITIPTVEAHLALAEWCLRFNLFPQAARELVDARGLDARHPKVALLERRLAVTSQPQPPAKLQTATADSSQPPPNVSDKSAAQLPVPQDLPHSSELSSLAIEQFTRKVQPILVNNCSTAGCHQLGGPQQFQLDRAVLHGMSNRRTTFQNLEATLTLINHESPQLSPLLIVPRHTHGGMDHAVFGPRQHQLIAKLAEWVAIVTNTVPDDDTAPDDASPTVASTTGEDPEGAADLPSAPRRGIVHTAKAPTGAPQTGSDTDSGVVQTSYEAEPATLGPPPKLRHGARVRKQPWRPKDPFDAEIFNRQSSPAPAKSPPRDE